MGTQDNGKGLLSAVSELKNEARSRVEDAVLEDLHSVGVDWYWQTDENLCFTWLSSNFEQITGTDPTLCIGRLTIDRFDKARMADARTLAHLERLQARQPFADFVYEIGQSREEPLWLCASGQPIFDANGQFQGYFGIGRDVTDIFKWQADIGDLKAELKGTKSLLSNICENLGSGLIVYDDQERVFMANQKMRELFPSIAHVLTPGTPRRTVLGESYDKNQYRIDKSTISREEWIEEKMQQRKSVLEQEQQLNDGRWLTLSEVRLANGYTVGLRSEITAMKTREERLEETSRQNALLRDILDQLDVAIYARDENLRLVYANSFWGKWAGMTPAQGQGLTDMDVFGEDGRAMMEADRKLMDTGGQVSIDETATDDDGRTIHRLARKRSFTAKDGSRYVIGSTTDVTRMKEVQADLNLSMDALDMAVVVVDADMRIQQMNPACHAIWKTTPETVPLGSHFRDLIDINRDNGVYDVMPDDWEAYVQRRLEEIAKGCVEPREFVRKDGKTLVYAVRPLSSGKRMLTYFDISEQKERENALSEAEQKAQLSDRAKSEFLANMSHEIRTPMNGVLGMAELLARSDLDDKQRTFTDIIVKSGNALLTIINDILDFSKIDAGQLLLDPAPFNLRESVEDVATLVSTRAKEKDLELIARVAPDLPQSFIGDAGRLRQIITNLMGNAVKFTEKGHVLVDISGTKADGKWRLRCRVVDTGIGIPADKLDAVFEKFSQVDASATRRHEGTGLGLAITSKLVDLMEGEIGVKSVLGEGSEFWFQIDLPEDENYAAKPRRIPIDVTGSRVLIIDDNPVNREILMEQMVSWSFDACAVESGELGLAMLRETKRIGCPVDMVVLDYQMPGMSGADVMAVLRADPSISDTPVVLLTSVDQALAPESLRGLNVDHHLLKPARSSQLLECIVDGIQSRKAAIIDVQEPQHESLAARPQEHASHSSTIEIAEPVQADESVDILIAEDNEVNQIVYTQIFNSLPWSYRIVDNGALAVEAIHAARPRMVLMDVSMPVMNGLSATQAIREAGFTDLPIVGVTAHALKGDSDRCYEAGMDDYLPKPISPDRLEEKVRDWLEGRKRVGQAGGAS